MKKLSKKVIAFALAVVMTLTAGAVAPQGNVEVQAASGRVYVNPYSATVVTYKPGSALSRFSSVISIMGCSKAKEIKNLKSSNKYIRLHREMVTFVLSLARKQLRVRSHVR